MLRTISIFSPRGIPGLLFPSLAENKQYCQNGQTECPGRPVHQWVHEGYTCGVSGRVLMTHPQAWCSESSRERRVSSVDLGNLRESGQGEGMVSTGFWKFALRIRNSNFYYADKSNFPGISRKLRIIHDNHQGLFLQSSHLLYLSVLSSSLLHLPLSFYDHYPNSGPYPVMS